MKKALLSLLLAVSLLLTFTSCDMITDALGSIVGIGAEETEPMKNNISLPNDKHEEEDVDEKTDDPQANVSAIVSSVNSGLELGSFVNTDVAENENYEEAIEQFRQVLKDFAFSKDISVTVDNAGDAATVYGYSGMKNGVIYTSMTGMSDTYVFIEDDFKIVTVEVDEYGDCYADVEGGLYEYIESILKTGQEDIDPDEESRKMMQFIEMVMEIELPEINKADVDYDEDDGRYYLSDEYTEMAIHEVAKKILEDYYEIYPEETPDNIYEGLEDGVADALEKFNLQIWINSYCEEIVGFGLSVDVDGSDIDESSEIGRIHGALDVVDGSADLSVVIEGTEDYEAECTIDASLSCSNNKLIAEAELKLESEDTNAEIKCFFNVDEESAVADIYCKTTGEDASDNVELSLNMSVSVDEEGMLEKADVVCNMTTPYSDSAYEYDEDGYGIYVRLRGKQTISVDLSVDMNKIEEGGSVADVHLQRTAGDFEAYVDVYDEYGYYDGEEYSAEYTEKYKDFTNQTLIEFEVGSSDGGDEITAKVVITQNDAKQDESVNVSMSAILENAEDKDFEVPSSVKTAREEALYEYENGYSGDAEEDYYY